MRRAGHEFVINHPHGRPAKPADDFQSSRLVIETLTRARNERNRKGSHLASTTSSIILPLSALPPFSSCSHMGGGGRDCH